MSTIPKTLIFVWIGPPMPDWIERNIKEFHRLNPGWGLRVVNEEALLPEWADTYERTKDICTKADLIAMSALKTYGGWYFDTDYWPFRSVDSIIETYGVNGHRMFVTEQHGQRAAELRIANGVMGVAKDWRGWSLIDQAVKSPKLPIQRCDFGPSLLTRLYDTYRDLFQMAPWPWFYPTEIGRSIDVYPTCLSGAANRYARRWAPTAGQLPFTMHVWAHGSTDPKNEKSNKAAALAANPAGKYNGLRAVMAALDIQWRDSSQPFQSIARGLANIGFSVEVQSLDKGNISFDTADLIAVWNGRKYKYKDAVDKANSFGVPSLVFEHGFLGNRRANIHINHQGILHWASWANDWNKPAPARAAEKFAAVSPDPIAKQAARPGGYVLVIGQVDGDSQLMDCEVKAADALQHIIKRKLPDGIPVVFRKHPLASRARQNRFPLSAHDSLRDDVAGARFAVTINSNAGNECLIWGCPVLCFGPALYANAGVAKQTTVKGIENALAEMQAGWHPEQSKVENYLHWLAARQFNQAELADGAVLAEIINQTSVKDLANEC